MVRKRAGASLDAPVFFARLSFHADQFVVLNSESDRVVASSVTDLAHQAAVARMIGAEALTLHGGGLTGGPGCSLRLTFSFLRATGYTIHI
jgi:UV DNA damage repair endonuclease